MKVTEKFERRKARADAVRELIEGERTLGRYSAGLRAIGICAAETTNTLHDHWAIRSSAAIELIFNLFDRKSFSSLPSLRGVLVRSVKTFLPLADLAGLLRGKSRTAGNFSGLILPDYLLQHPASKHIDTGFTPRRDRRTAASRLDVSRDRGRGGPLLRTTAKERVDVVGSSLKLAISK